MSGQPVRGQGRRVAVIGSGVAGLSAAHVLGREVRVTLFEADSRLGGHADTHVVDGIAVDTGFIVHNERTYPHLMRLFDELGVQTQDSDMSMSVRSDDFRLEWAGALGLAGLFPNWRNAVRPSYLRMLVEIPRFHRMARRVLTETVDGHSDETLASFLERGRFSSLFRTHFMESLVACVWSCDPAVALEYPARYLFAFLQHHGMLQIFGSPQWRTVTGGSREYVAKVAARLPDVRTGTKVTSVRETPDRCRDHRWQRPGRDLRRCRGRDPPRAGPRDARPTRPRRSARCSRRCRTRRTPPSCTPTPVSCRALIVPERRGTICAGRLTTAAL